MKKLLNIMLVSALLYAHVGYIIGYFASLQHIKAKRFNEISHSKNYTGCTKFTLNSTTQKEIHFEFWNKNEFEYKGLMYDIISIKDENGVSVIYALIDNQETNFIENFDAFIKKHLSGKSTIAIFFKFISNIDTSSLLEKFKLYLFDFKSPKFETQTLIILQNYFLEVLKPPPNILGN